MIDFISSWTQGIIIAVIIGTIIEMILPNGSCKKYIKVVIGIFILFNIIAPVIDKVSNGKIDISKIIDDVSIAYSTSDENSNIAKDITKQNNTNIKELYLNNLKNDMKNKIEEKGYNVIDINVYIDDNQNYTIKSISVNVYKKEEIKESINTIKIDEINISVNNEEIKEDYKKISDSEIKEIKEYLSSTYEVNKNYITINNK